MTDSKTNGLIRRLAFFLLLLCLLAGFAVAFFVVQNKLKIEKMKQQDLEALRTESYSCAFFSMYPIENYNVEDFTTYRGLPGVLSSVPLDNTDDLCIYLDTALSGSNAISNLYLGLDPYQLWCSFGREEASFVAALEEKLFPYMTAHPDITFEVLLPYPSLEYWVSLKDSKREEVFSAYRIFVNTLSTQANVIMFFPGYQEWLIANPGNYDYEYNTNALTSQKIMLFTFCDKEFQINPNNTDALLNHLSYLIGTEQTTPADYPDLSKVQAVFFGDSVFGNYEGSFSIPGVVNGLSGSPTYNYAIGGTPATDFEDYDSSFPDIVERFLSGQAESSGKVEPFTADSGKQLFFIINYGLNDYFSGYPLDNPADSYDTYTYCGALRSGILSLKQAYPDAKFILVTPSYCAYFSHGTEILSDQGNTYTDYLNATISLAEELDIPCLNISESLGITAENYPNYLADGCHLNENGRFLLGKEIISVISDQK